MKNNKYAPYILGVALVIVWGLVFYKIYKAVYGEEDSSSVSPFQTIPVYKGESPDSSFALLLDYKDPFLGKELASYSSGNNSGSSSSSNPSYSSSNPKKNNINPKQNTQPKTPLVATQTTPKKPFPTIIYQGFQIMDMDTIAILKIDGKFYPNARKGQYLNSVGIKGIYRDSVQLLFEGEQQTFIRRK